MLDLGAVIQYAVLHDRFELHYQPFFEISERRLIGYEALIRLPTKDGKLIPPLVILHDSALVVPNPALA